ncbi:MAG TPA: isoprenylcysteine carboxylmethyltransferase family protein [bacterium]|nr:isoprenylcysteine carboxylmethyltransferase family protein [bacterium]
MELRTLSAAIYIVGLVISEVLRLPQRFRRTGFGQERHKPEGSRRASEVIVLAAIAGGIWILPLLSIFTEWFHAFDYTLSNWISWLGCGVFLSSILLRCAAQSALGSSWSPTLETGSRQQLVTSGVYRWIRHPLYTSFILWAIAQPALLQNWIAGFSGSLAVAAIWFMRVPAEERMMYRPSVHIVEKNLQRYGAVNWKACSANDISTFAQNAGKYSASLIAKDSGWDNPSELKCAFFYTIVCSDKASTMEPDPDLVNY